MLPKGCQRCFTGNNRIFSIVVDHSKRDDTGKQNRPEERHTVGGAGFGHGSHAAGPKIEAKQKNAGQ